MSTIPAADIVQVLPGVVSAGGTSLVMNGLVLTTSTRVPIGTINQFPAASSVSKFFGPSSLQAAGAPVYFNSFLNSQQKPGALLYAQYNPVDVPAYLQSGNITSLGLAAIQAMTGTLSITVDGVARSAASLSLASATSYSAAGALIQAALTASEPTEASVTGAIASKTATLTGAINGYVLTVTAASGDPIVPGTILTNSGSTILAGTMVTEQLTQTGAAGGIGTYALKSSSAQTISSGSITGTYGLLTVSAVTSGTLSVGQTLAGTGVTSGTLLMGLGTGQGLAGTYYVTPAQTAASTAITATATPLTVTFDSVSGSFFITSGVSGAASTIGYATGTLSALLLMTSATGAILSQGANAATPAAFMDNLINYGSQNWATFWLDFDPDFGSGNTQKLAFCAWTSAQNSRFKFNCVDTDIQPTLQTPALQSLGYLIGPNGNNYQGINLIYDPNGLFYAAFNGAFAASLNFNARNGRTTAAYRQQPGLQATVTSWTVANNLRFNGYNSYGAWATANETWVGWFDGTISGPFLWDDSYVNQIYLNSQLQLAGMNLEFNSRSIPYNKDGYALVEGALHDPLQEGLNFGSIRTGVTLSRAQIDQITNTVGVDISPILFAQGFYVNVQDATPQVRTARHSPPIFVFYVDGESIQKLVINSLAVL